MSIVWTLCLYIANKRFCSLFAICFTFFPSYSLAQVSGCGQLSLPIYSNFYQMQIDSRLGTRRIDSDYFGFNIEWVEFQLSLWDGNNNRVAPEVIEWLKAFPGAIYRYPGGTVANYFEWRSAIGEVQSRSPQNPVSWRGPLVAEFGLPEYLSFVQSVGGKAWYVLNIYGTLNNEMLESEMTQEVSKVAAYLLKQREAGMPPIYRWELGNELDRDHYRWRPEKYSKVALEAVGKLHAIDKDAQVVSLAQDWPASKEKHGIEPAAYNEHLGAAFKGKTTEFATHLYYDGKPWGPPVPNLAKQHCRNSQSIQKGLMSAPSVWVTEHARTPKGTPVETNWKANWPQSADLSAAIGIADIAIALAPDPGAKGLFVHSLHGTDGPWPLFHRSKDGLIAPSATYWSLRMLRESLLEEVIPTVTKSNNQSGYEGGYDLRAVAFTNQQRDKISVWLVNRASMAITVRMVLADAASRKVTADMTILADEDPGINNYGGQIRVSPRRTTTPLAFDAKGIVSFGVPANAVMTVQFPIGAVRL